MILFDYAFGEAEAQAPASFFGCKTGFEYFLEIFGGDAFSGVCDIYQYLFFMIQDSDGDGTFPFHRVEGVLQQVFDDPVEEGPGDAGIEWSGFAGGGLVLCLQAEMDFSPWPFPDLFHHITDLPREGLFFQ